ncbi:hypothetical protein BHM03_00057436 [Ensete ventricosum]|nr:hypothetical protein BHM03_00057436 [Ensete ventricosum]
MRHCLVFPRGDEVAPRFLARRRGIALSSSSGTRAAPCLLAGMRHHLVSLTRRGDVLGARFYVLVCTGVPTFYQYRYGTSTRRYA